MDELNGLVRRVRRATPLALGRSPGSPGLGEGAAQRKMELLLPADEDRGYKQMFNERERPWEGRRGPVSVPYNPSPAGHGTDGWAHDCSVMWHVPRQKVHMTLGAWTGEETQGS